MYLPEKDDIIYLDISKSYDTDFSPHDGDIIGFSNGFKIMCVDSLRDPYSNDKTGLYATSRWLDEIMLFEDDCYKPESWFELNKESGDDLPDNNIEESNELLDYLGSYKVKNEK